MKGIYFNKQYQKWHARIHHNRKNHHLGYFGDYEQAVLARRRAEDWARR